MRQRRLRWVAGLAVICAAAGWVFPRPADSQVQYQYQFQILHAFVFESLTDGAGPEGPLVIDAKGNLCGAAGGGAYAGGTVFELTRGAASGQWTETILHNFPDGQDDGENPIGVIIDPAGDLYGMTEYGGTASYCTNDSGCGTIFELSPGANGQWTETILYNFCSLPGCPGGGEPLYGPTLGPGGVLYGIAGAEAFELTPGSGGWTATTLYTFCSQPNCTDGEYPSGSLTLDGKGNLYGETEHGGAVGGCGNSGCGVVFSLQSEMGAQWKEIVLHNFQESEGDGILPGGGVTLHQHGLYGTTQAGGGDYCFGGCGTVFELTRNPAATGIREQIVRAFGENAAEGILPTGGVVFDRQGNMFGMTAEGGTDGDGAVYGMKPQGNGKWGFAVLHTFVGTDGEEPVYGLTVDSKGNLYGTTYGGGSGGGGTAFELSPTTQSSK